nr:endo-alpha-N-acetylgalactosaminidase family protein [Anaerofilum sp. An201]
MQQAIQQAAGQLAQAEMSSETDPAVQEQLNGIPTALQAAVDALEPAKEDRIIVEESYADGQGSSVWSETPAVQDGALYFTLGAGQVAVNRNEQLNIAAGAYTMKLYTDSSARFGMAFNCREDGSFHAVYSNEAGEYRLKTAAGEDLVIASDSVQLKPNTEYEVCVVSDPYGVQLYIDSANIGRADCEGLADAAGSIGLYNPASETAELGVSAVKGYELYTYSNEFSTPESIGTWTGEKATVSHEAEGILNGSGELKMETQPVSFSFAEDTPRILNGIYEFDVISSPNNSEGRIVFCFRGQDKTSYAGLFYDIGGKWMMYNQEPGESESCVGFTSGVALTDKEKHHVKFEVEGNTVRLEVDGQEVGVSEFELPDTPGYFGIRKNYDSADIRLDNLRITETYQLPAPEKEEKPVSIASEALTVRMDETFPRVLDYSMNGKTLTGNPNKTYGLRVNGTLYYPVVSCERVSDSKLLYTLQIPNIGVTVKVRYEVVDNQLRIQVVGIEEEGGVLVNTLSFADDALFTTAPGDATASMGLVYADNTWTSVRENLYDTMDQAAVGQSYQTYATLSSGGLAATVNNSTIETGRRLNVNVWQQDGQNVGQVGNGIFDYHTPDGKTQEMPWATVVISEDINADGDVNWQDAAVSYADIKDEVFGQDEMMNNMMWIAYNSGSQAQEPFMKSLDMARKLYNYTDGFGQMVMHKGYQAEGHDDSHGDYGGHVGIRQGGAEDFNKIIELGKEYNVDFGIHINVNEHMLDSLYFNEESMMQPLAQNWGHWDQAYLLDQAADIISGNRDKNLDRLKEELPGLSFVYVDIYGVDSPAGWMSEDLARALNERGYIVGTEFSGPLEQGAAFTHWGNDLHYPNQGNRSIMMRFFKNDCDIFVANALTLGNKMPGVATWGNSFSLKEGVDTFYNYVLPTKYLQHLDLLDYEEGEYAVYSEGVRTEFTADKQYVVMTRNGREMARWEYLGVDSEGADLTGQTTLLLPWFEGEEGDPNSADKLYHWNPAGGQSTWQLPDSWADKEAADVYRLSGDDKEKIATVAIEHGSITLKAEPGVGYVLYPTGHAAPKVADDFGNGSPLDNPGFDTFDLDMWNVKATAGANAEVVESDTYETSLKMSGPAGSEVSVSQTLQDLTPGKTHTVYFFADIDENAQLKAEVEAGGKTYTCTAEAARMPMYGVARYNGTSYQKVKVTFDLPADADSALLTLTASLNGENAAVELDDIRVWENPGRTPQPGEEGCEDYVVYEDFENVEQGYGAFVPGGGNGSGWDHRAHLAEYREGSQQYTDYVVDGNFSLKITQDGLGNLVRTDANTVQLKPNTTYQLKLDYITGVTGRYALFVKNGAGDEVLRYDFTATELEEGKHSLSSRSIDETFATGDSDDYYVSIDIVNNDITASPEAPEMGSQLERTFLSLDNFAIIEQVERFETTFVVDGESFVVSTRVGEPIEMPADPVKEGFRFVGWFTAPENGQPVTEFTQEQTVYAVFEPVAEPTASPEPTTSPEPTAKPTAEPTASPTEAPAPSPDASASPTQAPTQPDSGSSLPATGDAGVTGLAALLALAAGAATVLLRGKRKQR